jgi:Fic family protein
VAHLWFVTIHPFEDGNGRIARVLTDMLLARIDQSPYRFYSMSSQILIEKNSHYDLLERAQKGGLDITEWITWFIDCLDRSIARSGAILGKTLAKAAFWERANRLGLNARQTKILRLLLDDFKGNMTTSKWAKIAKTSEDTALRDIRDLETKDLMRKEPAGGRSTNYSLVLDAQTIEGGRA